MNDSRKSALDGGKYYILWGVIIGISCIVNYFIYSNGSDISPNYFWFPFIGIGWAISIYWGYKDSKKQKSISLGKKVISAVWSACGLAALVIAIPAQISGTISGSAICGLITAVFGIGYLVAGVVYSDKMLVTLAFVWWLAASWMFFVNGIEILLIYGLFLLLFQVIPGFILNFKWKKELTLNN
jgi:hypothetical protein